jgi:hypothetical protein
MPYYVYAVKPFAQLEKLAQFDAFKDASTHAKALRAAQPEGSVARIKVMFADTELGAEDLLSQVRMRERTGDDD